jgi:hypothetical protein
MDEGLRSARLARLKTRSTVNEKGCWIWNGPLDKDGYGICTNVRDTTGVTTKRAHRAAFYFKYGWLPPLLDHIVCDTEACCNPEHMEPSTDEKNVLRGSGPTAVNAAKTHCPKGHAYDSTTVQKGRVWRRCSTCLREQRRLQAKRRYARFKQRMSQAASCAS